MTGAASPTGAAIPAEALAVARMAGTVTGIAIGAATETGIKIVTGIVIAVKAAPAGAVMAAAPVSPRVSALMSVTAPGALVIAADGAEILRGRMAPALAPVQSQQIPGAVTAADVAAGAMVAVMAALPS